MPRRPLAAALSFLLLPLALGAQVGRTTYAADGEGRLVTGDAAASQEITRVEAILFQNGGLELALFKGRNRWVFMGSWTGDPAGGSVGIRLDEAFDRAAEATGRLYFDRNQVERARFSGSNRDGRFEFGFEGRSSGGGGPTAEGEVATTRNGEGSVRVDTVSYDVNRARVRLYKNGRAQLRLWGAQLVTIDGRWTGNLDASSVRISVPDWEGEDADLRGTVSLSRRNGWDRVTLEGPTAWGPFKLGFEGRSAALEYDNSGPLVTTLEKTMRGTGTLAVTGRPTEDISLVRIHLKRNWQAVIQVQGVRERAAFQGSWLQRGEEPKLTLAAATSTLGRETTGTGTLEMQGEERWRTLTLSGTSAAGDWRLTFRATDGVKLLFDPGDAGAPALVTELASEQPGTGTVQLPIPNTPPRAVRRVRVTLLPNQDAAIAILEGDTTGTLTGRWSPGDRPGRVSVALTGGTLKGWRGNGRVEFSDALALTRVSLEGRILSLRSKLEFTAQGAPPR